MNYPSRFVSYGSAEYKQAIQLRYRLFYAEHGLEIESVLTPREQSAKHFVVLSLEQTTVLAYGQLYKKNNNEYQIFQMVVEPSYQRQGLGSIVLEKLIQAAICNTDALITLSARTAYAEFYRKFGFETEGSVFPSSSTGLPHIKMTRQCTRTSF